VNIVVINDAAYIRGGADRVAFDSARALGSLGHSVTLFTAFGPVAAELESAPGVTVVCVGSPWIRNGQTSFGAAVRGIWNSDASRRLKKVLSGLNPRETVVHVHLYAGALSPSVLAASVRCGFLTVLTLHDYFITCPNGAYFVFPKGETCGRNALSGSCLRCNCDSRRAMHKAWRVARTWVQNSLADIPRRLTAYIAVSETCAALARRDLPAAARIEVIPNIVGVDRRPPVDVARNKAFVFTGRLEDYKGPQLLAQAAARLRLPVVFCGAGPLEAELRRIYPDAVFKGWLRPEQVISELERARAFVFPSVYRETFGLAAAEALARGIPVVASRGTAAEEFVFHEKNGLLFDHNSVDDLAVRLGAMADDSRVATLGANAYARYWDNPLTAEAHVSRLVAFYTSILESRLAGNGKECAPLDERVST
jgi:glycosyltransferase involved in cell wall biosynthesis